MEAHIKQAMILAKTLITEKKYYDARIILRTIDHPKAREWLEKLDKRIEQSNIVSSLANNSSDNLHLLSTTNRNDLNHEKPKSLKDKLQTCLVNILIFFFCGTISIYYIASQTSDAERVLKRVFPSHSIEIFTDDNYVTASIKVWRSPSPGSTAREELNRKLIDAICQMRDSYQQHRFEFDIIHGSIIRSGAVIPDIVLIITLSQNSARRLNCIDQASNDLSRIATVYRWAPG